MINTNCKTSLEIRECFEKWVEKNPKLIYNNFENDWMAVELSKDDVAKLLFEDSTCNYPSHAATLSVLSVCSELKKDFCLSYKKSDYDALSNYFRWNCVNKSDKRALVGLSCKLPNSSCAMIYLLIKWENGYYYGVCGIKDYQQNE